jgi:dTDP-4-amino-4,6-dideoxygalactose transaminase
MAPLLAIGARHGIPVIEDAAQAAGSRYHNRSVGSFGLCGCFSYYPSKNLGAYGEAGAIVTDDEEVATRLRALRDHAQQRRHVHDEVGYNYRMDAFQGAVLSVKLPWLARWVADRRRLAARYLRALADLPLQLPTMTDECSHGWHLFVVRHPERDLLRASLEAHGVLTGLHYPVPVHLQPAYASLGYEVGSFPVAEQIARECLTLPLFPEMTLAEQDRVIEALTAILTVGGAYGIHA